MDQKWRKTKQNKKNNLRVKWGGKKGLESGSLHRGNDILLGAGSHSLSVDEIEEDEEGGH